MADDGALDASYEDWELLGTRYFSRRELYSLAWSRGPRGSPGVNLEYMRIFCCSFGGPVAVCRDENKVVLQLGSFSRPDIQIFTAAGAPLGRVLWDSGRIVAAGWTLSEELVVVDDRGRVHRFTPLGQPSTAAPAFSLGAACEDEGVVDVVVEGGVIIARTGAGHLWCIDDVEREPRPQRFPDPARARAGAVHCMIPLPPSTSSSGSLEVLVAVDSTVVIVDADEAMPSAVEEGPVVALAVSPERRRVAGFSADGVVYIWSANLEETLVTVAVGDTAEDAAEALGVDRDPAALLPGPPDGFVWCGEEGVLAAWAGLGALLVTTEGAARWWELGPGGVALIGEVDGARVVTQSRHDLLRPVPDALAAVLEMGSTSPGAMLHDARKLFDQRDARAAAELLDVLRSGDLPEAAAACLAAAVSEIDPAKQEALMRAGCYGRAFLALEASGGTDLELSERGLPAAPAGQEVVTAARTLRVLNALRDPAVALPLTVPQLQALGLRQLALRLCGRRHYLLALRACTALGISTEDVLLRWACDKIAASASSAPDDELLGLLRAKLEGQLGVKWAKVAAQAQAQGRPRLAAALAERETCAGDQVPLLLALGEVEAALRKASEAGDPDLTFDVMHAMWRHAARSQAGQQQFWAAMTAHPSAAALMTKFLEHTDGVAAMALRQALGDHRSAAAVHVTAAIDLTAAAQERHREWERAKSEYAKDEKSGHEDAKFEATAAAAALRLAEVQTELERTTGREGFLGLSVIETVRQCLRLGLRDHASKMGREFHVPEKQAMLLAIGTAAAAQDWSALQTMAGKLDRKAPLSMEHFVAATREHGAPLATVRWFVDRLAGDNALVRKAQIYAELGLQREAAMLAEQAELQGASTGMLGNLSSMFGRGS